MSVLCSPTVLTLMPPFSFSSAVCFGSCFNLNWKIFIYPRAAKKFCCSQLHVAHLLLLAKCQWPLFQIWRRLHSDRAGCWFPSWTQARRGLYPADVPRQRSQGESPQHTPVPTSTRTRSSGQHLQPLHPPPAEAKLRGLLCVPDYSGSGETETLNSYYQVYLVELVWKVIANDHGFTRFQELLSTLAM